MVKMLWTVALVLLLGVLVKSNVEVEEKPEQAISFCDAIEDSVQREAIISCIQSIFPPQALEVLSQCREQVFGKGTFDEVLFSFCDDDPQIQKWLRCNTRLYKEREVTFTKEHNEDVE